MNKVQYFVFALEIILACSIAANVYFYSQYQSVKPSSTGQVAFTKEFGDVLVIGPNYSFSPPITMYRALTIALESDQWNASSLVNMTITISLNYMEFTNSSSQTGEQTISELTAPAQSYADLQVNSTVTYRYVWEIQVNRPSNFVLGYYGFYYVDAQTGILLPTPLIY